MIETYLLQHPWLPAVLWAVLYTSDYYLTIYGAKLYRAQTVFEVEGSYELTPEYQDDVDRERLVSPTFILWLMCVTCLLLAAGYVSQSILFLYGILVGFMIVPQLAVHIRHIGNIFHFRKLADSKSGIGGHVKWSRRALYEESSVNMAGIAVFTLCAYVLTGSSILLGGVLGLAWLAFDNIALARRQKRCRSDANDIEP